MFFSIRGAPEAGPAGARVILGVGAEEGCVADDAEVGALLLIVPVGAVKGFQLPLPGFSGSPRLFAAATFRTTVFFANIFEVRRSC